MHETGSLLYTILDRFRHYADKSVVDVHKDPFLINEVLMPVWAAFFQQLRLTDERELLMTMTVTLTAGTEFYELPPVIDSIAAISIFDTRSQLRIGDKYPRHHMHPNDVGWCVQGNELQIRPKLMGDPQDWTLFYRPSGEGLMHYGSGTLVDASTVILDDDPELGQLDRRVNAYAGCILRLLTEGDPIQERIIQSYNVMTRTATVRNAFNEDMIAGLSGSMSSSGAECTYEIAPLMMQTSLTALAAKMAMHLAPSKAFTQAKIQTLESIWLDQVKAHEDRLRNTIERAMRHFERNTIDNPLLLDDSSLAMIGRW